MWDLPGPGLESMSPAMAGGFSTTVPPGKPGKDFLDVTTKAQSIKEQTDELDFIKMKIFSLQKILLQGPSLVAQWLRICLLMQGTRVRALVWEDPTCRGATGPVSHNY